VQRLAVLRRRLKTSTTANQPSRHPCVVHFLAAISAPGGIESRCGVRTSLSVNLVGSLLVSRALHPATGRVGPAQPPSLTVTDLSDSLRTGCWLLAVETRTAASGRSLFSSAAGQITLRAQYARHGAVLLERKEQW
jgi:hypothetical protein